MVRASRSPRPIPGAARAKAQWNAVLLGQVVTEVYLYAMQVWASTEAAGSLHPYALWPAPPPSP